MKKLLVTLIPVLLVSQPMVNAEEAGEASLKQGLEAFNSGDLKTAEQLLQEVLEVDAESSEALYYLGLSKFVVGDTEGALDYYTQGRDAHPDEARFHSMRGHCLNMLGQSKPMNEGMLMFMEGLEEYRTAVRLDAMDVEGHYGLAQYYAHAPAMAGGSMPLAEEHAGIVTQINEARGNGLMAMLKMMQGLNEEAQSYAEKALAVDPGNGEALRVVNGE